MKITIQFEKLQEMMELHKFRFDGHVNGYGELLIDSIFWDEVPTELTGEINDDYYEMMMEANEINEITGMLSATALKAIEEQLEIMDAIEIGKILQKLFENEIKKAIA
jgi:heat shock protein HspQ